MLGIEINDGYICMGFGRHKKLVCFERLSAPVVDGEILDLQLLTSIISNYVRANKPGRAALLTINTSKAVLRFAPSPTGREKSWRSVFAANKLAGYEPDVFPFDTAGYATGYRFIGKDSVLVCCIPENIPQAFADVIKAAGLIPIGIGIYIDSLTLALELTGRTAVCVVRGCLIYVENGVLKELILFENLRELETALGGLGAVVPEYAYNLTNSDWADNALSRIGCKPIREDELALKGLLKLI